MKQKRINPCVDLTGIYYIFGHILAFFYSHNHCNDLGLLTYVTARSLDIPERAWQACFTELRVAHDHHLRTATATQVSHFLEATHQLPLPSCWCWLAWRSVKAILANLHKAASDAQIDHPISTALETLDPHFPFQGTCVTGPEDDSGLLTCRMAVSESLKNRLATSLYCVSGLQLKATSWSTRVRS